MLFNFDYKTKKTYKDFSSSYSFSLYDEYEFYHLNLNLIAGEMITINNVLVNNMALENIFRNKISLKEKIDIICYKNKPFDKEDPYTFLEELFMYLNSYELLSKNTAILNGVIKVVFVTSKITGQKEIKPNYIITNKNFNNFIIELYVAQNKNNYYKVDVSKFLNSYKFKNLRLYKCN